MKRKGKKKSAIKKKKRRMEAKRRENERPVIEPSPFEKSLYRATHTTLE
ncbi:hypothetical protein M3M33_05155 [Loigolactobacillus coryniformis]|nr:hypothetical protein [Loigolactobacillus coryniformis]MCL5458060.1 hypothetical protein [Loigolactobacillus coryniformis]